MRVLRYFIIFICCNFVSLRAFSSVSPSSSDFFFFYNYFTLLLSITRLTSYTWFYRLLHCFVLICSVISYVDALTNPSFPFPCVLLSVFFLRAIHLRSFPLDIIYLHIYFLIFHLFRDLFLSVNSFSWFTAFISYSVPFSSPSPSSLYISFFFNACGNAVVIVFVVTLLLLFFLLSLLLSILLLLFSLLLVLLSSE